MGLSWRVDGEGFRWPGMEGLGWKKGCACDGSELDT